MSMTRQDFTAVAHCLRASIVEDVQRGRPGRAIAVRLVANDLADLFATKYPNFDRDRFLAACDH